MNSERYGNAIKLTIKHTDYLNQLATKLYDYKVEFDCHEQLEIEQTQDQCTDEIIIQLIDNKKGNKLNVNEQDIRSAFCDVMMKYQKELPGKLIKLYEHLIKEKGKLMIFNNEYNDLNGLRTWAEDMLYEKYQVEMHSDYGSIFDYSEELYLILKKEL